MAYYRRQVDTKEQKQTDKKPKVFLFNSSCLLSLIAPSLPRSDLSFGISLSSMHMFDPLFILLCHTDQLLPPEVLPNAYTICLLKRTCQNVQCQNAQCQNARNITHSVKIHVSKLIAYLYHLNSKFVFKFQSLDLFTVQKFYVEPFSFLPNIKK